MTDIHGQKGGEMLQYLEMSAVLPAGFSQLWSMGISISISISISIPLPRRLVLRALEAGECLSAFKKYRKSERKRTLWQHLRSAKRKKNV